MMRSVLRLLMVLALFVPGLMAATPGNFRGVVVKAPDGESTSGYIYLKSKGGIVRRVAVTRASVQYDASVPSADRVSAPPKALVPGAEVRVTAEVDSASGEWTASRIDIVSGHSAALDLDSEDDEDDAGIGSPQTRTVAVRTI